MPLDHGRSLEVPRAQALAHERNGPRQGRWFAIPRPHRKAIPSWWPR